MLSNGQPAALPHQTFDLVDELSLELTHLNNLLTLAIDSTVSSGANDNSILFTLHSCMQARIVTLRTLLRSHVEGGAR